MQNDILEWEAVEREGFGPSQRPLYLKIARSRSGFAAVAADRAQTAEDIISTAETGNTFSWLLAISKQIDPQALTAAEQWFINRAEISAKNNSADDAFLLGSYYLQGCFGKNDYANAEKWIKQAIKIERSLPRDERQFAKAAKYYLDQCRKARPRIRLIGLPNLVGSIIGACVVAYNGGSAIALVVGALIGAGLVALGQWLMRPKRDIRAETFAAVAKQQVHGTKFDEGTI